MFEKISGPRSMSSLVGFGVLAVFGYLNATNWCSPGWCWEYGWPFTHYFVGDAILVMDGVESSSGFFTLPLLGNFAVAFGAASLAIWVTQRIEKRRAGAV